MKQKEGYSYKKIDTGWDFEFTVDRWKEKGYEEFIREKKFLGDIVYLRKKL